MCIYLKENQGLDNDVEDRRWNYCVLLLHQLRRVINMRVALHAPDKPMNGSEYNRLDVT